MWILKVKVCTWTKPKVSVSWHWNSVNKAIMLLPKNVPNNFAKAMFFFQDV